MSSAMNIIFVQASVHKGQFHVLPWGNLSNLIDGMAGNKASNVLIGGTKSTSSLLHVHQYMTLHACLVAVMEDFMEADMMDGGTYNGQGSITHCINHGHLEQQHQASNETSQAQVNRENIFPGAGFPVGK